jgi:hypothetical protein
MGARWYSPEIGRFLSADTIVPNPANPQSYNRYAYVRNNPINFTDPTGHRECAIKDIDCSNPIPHPVGGSLVTFGGAIAWTDAEKAVVQAGAMQVAEALFLAGGEQFNSPREAFMAVYGGAVKFRKTGVGADNLGEATSENGRLVIKVNNHPDVGITDPTTGAMWAAHELGHAFNIATKQEGEFWGPGYIDLAREGVWVNGTRIAGNTNPISYSDNNTYVRTADGYRPGLAVGINGPYQQNTRRDVGEDFADMFMNWAFSSFADTNAGVARYNWMDNHMSTWISLAVANNQ